MTGDFSSSKAETLTAAMHRAMPFTALLDVAVLHASAERVDFGLQWSQALCTAAGQLHGGALMTLADAAGGYLAFLNRPAGVVANPTTEFKINLLRGVRDGQVVASASALHVGRRLVVIETSIMQTTHLVAKSTQSHAWI